jgi:outer membrane protein
MKIQYSIITLLALSTLTSIAKAELPIPANIGAVVKYEQSIFKNGDAKISFLPATLDESGFDIPGLTWSFIDTPTAQYYIGASLDDLDADRGDSPDLQDMEEIDMAINLRVGAAWKMDAGVINLDLAQDVAAHKGLQAKARYTFNPAPHQSPFRPYVEAQWLSDKVVDNYVGVNANEAKADRPAYTGEAGMAYKAGINAHFPISDKFTVVGGVDVTHYSDEFKDSPIVDEATVMGAHLGMTYRWK